MILIEKGRKKKKIRGKKKKIEKDYLERLKRYEDQGELLRDVIVFSKTDPDATFMRMKETR